MKQVTSKQWCRKGLLGVLGAAILSLVAVRPTNAQYFESRTPVHTVVKASGYDSIIVEKRTSFQLPAVPDSIEFTYHEPMPDSIMPRSAVVIGTITLQAETPEDLVANLEEYARKNGADWIVSFAEPHASLTKDHYKVYRSTALLLHVLDDNFINQNDVAYNYYDNNKVASYAALQSYWDTYGRRMGAKIDPAAEDPTIPDTPESER